MATLTLTKQKDHQWLKLETEWPLTEKDQQARAIEQQRKLGEKALEEWRRRKPGIKSTAAN